MSVFEDGPIGFEVSIIGWEEGLPVVIARVANGHKTTEYKFKRYNGEWRTGEKILNSEEQGFLSAIWNNERRKRGIKND